MNVLAVDIAIYLNTQTRRIKQRKEKFVPVERLLGYCRELPVSIQNSNEASGDSNIVSFSDYRSRRQ